MKSILDIYKEAVGPSSTLNMIPYRACRDVGRQMHQRKLSVHHIEVDLYNEYARLEKVAGIKNDINNALCLNTFDHVVYTDKPVPPAVKAAPYAFDILIYTSPTEVLEKHRVVGQGGGSYVFTEEFAKDPLPEQTFADIQNWFAKNKGKTYVDFCAQACDRDEITAMYHRGMTLARCSINAGLVLKGEVKTDVKDVHYVRRAHTIWRHDETTLSQPEDMNRVISAFSYAISERVVEKDVLVAAPTLCTSATFWSVMYYLRHERNVPDKKLIEAFAAAGIFACLMEEKKCLGETAVGCQGPMGTACGMAAVAVAVALYNADINECGRAFEMALEHILGVICDCASGLPIIPCIQRCATYATRAFEIAILNHSLMVTPEICKLDDVIDVLKETGADLLVKNKRLGFGGFADHAKYALDGSKK